MTYNSRVPCTIHSLECRLLSLCCQLRAYGAHRWNQRYIEAERLKVLGTRRNQSGTSCVAKAEAFSFDFCNHIHITPTMSASAKCKLRRGHNQVTVSLKSTAVICLHIFIKLGGTFCQTFHVPNRPVKYVQLESLTTFVRPSSYPITLT